MSTHAELATAAGLARFLIDRIEDDEDALNRVARAENRGVNRTDALDGLQAVDRLRAELIAKRHVIGDLQHLMVLRDLPIEQQVRDVALRSLALLATPYRAHPRFRGDWAPLIDDQTTHEFDRSPADAG